MFEYFRGDSLTARVEVKDEDDNYVTPSAIEIIIYDSAGTVKIPTGTPPSGNTISNFTLVSTGIYEFKYSIPSDAAYGEWLYKITTTYNNNNNVEINYFDVRELPVGLIRYCSVNDVVQYMGIADKINNATNASVEDVREAIIAMQDHIEQYTHHAWRSVTVTDEYYDFPGFYQHSDPIFAMDWSDRARIYLKHRKIVSLTKLEVWDGRQYVDYKSVATEGRNADYWLESDKGVIHFASRYPWITRKSIRVSYTYGDSSVPASIKRACVKLAAAELLQQDDYSVLMPEGTSNIPPQDKSIKWREEAYALLEPFIELTGW